MTELAAEFLPNSCRIPPVSDDPRKSDRSHLALLETTMEPSVQWLIRISPVFEIVHLYNIFWYWLMIWIDDLIQKIGKQLETWYI